MNLRHKAMKKTIIGSTSIENCQQLDHKQIASRLKSRLKILILIDLKDKEGNSANKSKN